MLKLALFLSSLALPATAESLIATRVIRAQTVLTTHDMTLVSANIPGAMTEIAAALGLETRVTLYPGRAIRAQDIGPPALVDRNQIVTLHYTAGGLGISTEGRTLARGGMGDLVQVMNLASRAVLVGRIANDGTIHIGTNP